MDWIKELLHTVLHLDDVLPQWVALYGPWIYAILFLIIFCETGLVVTPFLPGDSLLFAIGALCAAGILDLTTSILLMTCAAILGDFVNYSVGARVGGRIFKEGNLILKKSHLEKTRAFYAKYGAKTVVLARFLPIIRTVAPFVAGMGSMNYRRFVVFNVAGAILWVVSMAGAGYLFGNLPYVRDNFEMVIIGIIFASLLPLFIEFARHHLRKPAPAAAPSSLQ